MSSEINTAFLKRKDLKMLQDVLVSCGHTGNISTSAEREFNTAAKLIIKLYLQGLREPVQLANALRRNFDNREKGANVISFPGRHRDAALGGNAAETSLHRQSPQSTTTGSYEP